MYSKEEARLIRKKFWTAFGQYMKIQPSSSGENPNWVNYKTGVKDLYFKTEADNKKASISIQMHQKDEGIRNLMYEQFEGFQPLFNSYFEEDWAWFQDYYTDEGKPIGLIILQLDNVNIFKEQDWPGIIGFFKSNLMKLDAFWNDAKDSFEIFK